LTSTEYFTQQLSNTHFFFSLWDFLQNRSYFRTQRKSQQIQANQNNPLHHIRSQWNETRPQQQKNPQKILKHMETEQHIAKKPMGDQSHKGRIKKFLESSENENTT
jgi:hypothetical protein